MHSHTLFLLPLLKGSPTCAHMVSIAQTMGVPVHQAWAVTGSKGKSGTEATQLR